MKKVNFRNATKVVFDIETIRSRKSFYFPKQKKKNLDDYQKSFMKYFDSRKKDGDTLEKFYEEKAGLIPEFSMIVSIVCFDSVDKIPVRFNMLVDDNDEGFDPLNEDMWKLREKAMLLNFEEYINDLSKEKGLVLIGHHIKGFDIPFLNTRYAANGMSLNAWLKTYGVKPWELDHLIDTKEIWKGGLYSTTQNATLDNCCRVLGIESPKGKGEMELDGSMVGDYFWNGEGSWMERIKNITDYDERDVKANVNLFNGMVRLGMF